MTETTTAAEPIVYDVHEGFHNLPRPFVAAYCAWLAAHGIDEDSTYRTEHHLIDAPLVRVFQMDRNADGRFYLDQATDDIAERTPYDVLIQTPAPSPADYAQEDDRG